MFEYFRNIRSGTNFYSRETSYSKLLSALILLILLGHILTGKIGGIILALCFLLANIWEIETLNFTNQFLGKLRLIAISGFFFQVISIPGYPQITSITNQIALLAYSIFMSLAILAIGKRIFSEKAVNSDLIKGGICIFLMLGLLWSLFYQLLYSFNPDCFNFSFEKKIEEVFVYFSFTTLTTLGYGDITPAIPTAKLLTNAEAIVGQLYPSIFIARLVALWQD